MKSASKAPPPTPTIVIATSENQLKLWRQERASALQTDAEAGPEIEAFFTRMMRPPGR